MSTGHPKPWKHLILDTQGRPGAIALCDCKAELDAAFDINRSAAHRGAVRRIDAQRFPSYAGDDFKKASHGSARVLSLTDMPFLWKGQLRITAGRTVVWGRQSYRYSDLDLNSKQWPLDRSVPTIREAAQSTPSSP